jgi:NAD(P)-dependent dehydrogenase (short-subunit alcohol dehydrogenase family)
MGALDGRVAIITGSGRGLGREHALLLAAEGAAVVVNDVGVETDGTGSDQSAAQAVVDEITSMGGRAIAHTRSVSAWDGAKDIVDRAIEAFGTLHVLVNNAGILRDRMTPNMTEDDWDRVIDVHLRGHFAPTKWAAAYWRDRHRAGHPIAASIINTSSAAGLLGNFGQLNYAAAKAGIAAMTLVEAMELEHYGVRANCIAPVARTRLTLQTPGVGEVLERAAGAGGFDSMHPGNVSPLVAYLAAEDCPWNGGVFHVGGNEVALMSGWSVARRITTAGRWGVAELARKADELAQDCPPIASQPLDIAGLAGAIVPS